MDKPERPETCFWCESPISELIEYGGFSDRALFAACDKECAHAQNTVNRLYAELNLGVAYKVFQEKSFEEVVQEDVLREERAAEQVINLFETPVQEKKIDLFA